MMAWYESLTAAERIFAAFGIPAAIVMLVQTVLLLLGFLGGGEADIPSDTSGLGEGMDIGDTTGGVDPINTPGDSGLRMFSVRGIVAFFAVFGWTALAVSRSGGPITLASGLGVAAGLAALFALAWMMRAILRMQEDGTADERTAIGRSASVYLQIPAGRSGTGKVTVLVSSQLREFDAVTDDGEVIPTGREVTVVGLSGRSTMVVRRK
jgi:hypothetical protein